VHGRNYEVWFREKAPVVQRYNYLYRADELEPWAELAREIGSMVSGPRATARSAVYETYGDVLADFAGPEDQFAGSTSFVDGRALNG
jgi:hypothetical protein